MERRYQLVLFDMDGTFIDSRPFHARLFFEFFKKYWKPVDYERCYRAVGTTVRELFDQCGLPKEHQEAYFDLLDDYYNNECTDLIPMTRASEGFSELLKWLRGQGVKTGVVTNSLDCVVRKILKYHGLWDLFDNITGADRNSKDKKDRCRKILNRYQISPEHVLYVGDTESDLLLANEMGFDACFAKTPIAWFQDEEYIRKELKPAITVQSYFELRDVLENTDPCVFSDVQISK
ncbi:MAG: HAD family hydrolase [Eubacteriales bacterium]|nr:HAD family hydrolase [Eubacteriales bacterium]